MRIGFRAGQFRLLVVWVVAALLAIMPAVAMAAEAPAGAFSRVFVHIHPPENDAPHEHATVHDHGDGQVHEHADGDHSHGTADQDRHGLVHIHYDVATPSGLVPFDGLAVSILHRLCGRLSIPVSAELESAASHRLLRPPI